MASPSGKRRAPNKGPLKDPPKDPVALKEYVNNVICDSTDEGEDYQESYDAEYVEVAVEDVDVEVVDVPYQEAEEPDLITLDEIDKLEFDVERYLDDDSCLEDSDEEEVEEEVEDQAGTTGDHEEEDNQLQHEQQSGSARTFYTDIRPAAAAASFPALHEKIFSLQSLPTHLNLVSHVECVINLLMTR